jgi:DNA-directed RNA polymerase subunit RPC12/RpoP
MSFDNVPAFVQHVNSHEPSGDVGENVGLNTDIRLQGNYKTIYICRCCDKKFANYDFVKDHLKQVFENESKNLDIQHQQIINEMGGVDVVIEYNKYIFSVSIGNLKSIESSVITKKTVIYHCAKCSTNFKDKQSLFGHVKSCKIM